MLGASGNLEAPDRCCKGPRDDFSRKLRAGVAAVVLWIAGLAITDAPDTLTDKTDAQILGVYQHHANNILFGSWLFMLGCVFFLWFAGTLRGRMAEAEGGRHTFTGIAYGAAVAATVFGVGTMAGPVAVAINKNDVSAAPAGALTHIDDLFFVGAELTLVAMFAAAALVAFRTVPDGADLRRPHLDARHDLHADAPEPRQRADRAGGDVARARAPRYAALRGARSSAGQSSGLIIRWSQVRVLAGPLRSPRGCAARTRSHGGNRRFPPWALFPRPVGRLCRQHSRCKADVPMPRPPGRSRRRMENGKRPPENDGVAHLPR